jgi:hypothetical protein
MANINLQQFISELRTEFLSVYNAVVDITAEAAFNNAALVVLARQIDGGGQLDRQPSLTLTRGQKAARTRKKNAAAKARATNSNAHETSSQAGAE